MTASDDAATRAAGDAYWSARASVLKIAQARGAEVRERKIWPDSDLTTRYAEPLAGIRAAVTARDAATRVVGDYIKHAREDGEPWLEIGKALGLEGAGDGGPYDLAVAAFDFAAGQPDLWHRSTFSWTCPACGKFIRDYGPGEANPEDNEEGHAEGCARMTEAIRAYRSQWDEEDDDG